MTAADNTPDVPNDGAGNPVAETAAEPVVSPPTVAVTEPAKPTAAEPVPKVPPENENEKRFLEGASKFDQRDERKPALVALEDYLKPLFVRERLARAIFQAVAGRVDAEHFADKKFIPIMASHPAIAYVAANHISAGPLQVLCDGHRDRLRMDTLGNRERPLLPMLKLVQGTLVKDGAVVLPTWHDRAADVWAQMQTGFHGQLIAPVKDSNAEDAVDLLTDQARLFAEIAFAALEGDDWLPPRREFIAQVAEMASRPESGLWLFELLNRTSSDDFREQFEFKAEERAGRPVAGYDFPSPADDPRYAAALFVATYFQRLEPQTFIELTDTLAQVVPQSRLSDDTPRPPSTLTDDVLAKLDVRFGGHIKASIMSSESRTKAVSWFGENRLLRERLVAGLKLCLTHGHENEQLARALAGLTIADLAADTTDGLAPPAGATSYVAGRLKSLFFGPAASDSALPPNDAAWSQSRLERSMRRAPRVIRDLSVRGTGIDIAKIVHAITATRPGASTTPWSLAFPPAMAQFFWETYAIVPIGEASKIGIESFAPFFDDAPEWEPYRQAAVSRLRNAVLERDIELPSDRLLAEVAAKRDDLMRGRTSYESLFAASLRTSLQEPLRGATWADRGPFAFAGSAVERMALIDAAWHVGNHLSSVDSAGIPDEAVAVEALEGQATDSFLAATAVLEAVVGVSGWGDRAADALDTWADALLPWSGFGFLNRNLWALERDAARRHALGEFAQAVRVLHRGIPVVVALLACRKPQMLSSGELDFQIDDAFKDWLARETNGEVGNKFNRGKDFFERISALGALGDRWSSMRRATLKPTPMAQALWHDRRTALERFIGAVRRSLSGTS